MKSEIKMLRDRDREVKILENSGQFSRHEILQQNYSVKAKKDCPNSSSSRNHQHFDTLTIEKSESFFFADVTAGQLVFKEEEVADFQDDFTHLALASTTRGGLTTWRRTSTRLSTRTLMTWRANLRSSRSSFLC